MQIIRGTSPTIIINVRSNLDLTHTSKVWVYIYQQGHLVVDREIAGGSTAIDTTNKKITLELTQQDTLALKANSGALFQVRLLLSSGKALATLASNVEIKEIYKEGIIS